MKFTIHISVISKKKNYLHYYYKSPFATQALQTRTGWFQPLSGTGFKSGEQLWQTPFPQALQWCFNNFEENCALHKLHSIISSSGIQYDGRAESFIMPETNSEIKPGYTTVMSTTCPNKTNIHGWLDLVFK